MTELKAEIKFYHYEKELVSLEPGKFFTQLYPRYRLACMREGV